jgi:hypothetical protein
MNVMRSSLSSRPPRQTPEGAPRQAPSSLQGDPTGFFRDSAHASVLRATFTVHANL